MRVLKSKGAVRQPPRRSSSPQPNNGAPLGYDYMGTAAAWLYHEGVMTDLTSLVTNLPEDFIVRQAFGINDRGQIIASGSNSGFGNYQVLLLTPVSSLAGVNLLLLLD